MQPLKRCPFCHADAALRIETNSGATLVFCQSRRCFAGRGRLYRTKDEAIEAWNLRPDPFIRDHDPPRPGCYIAEVIHQHELDVLPVLWDPIHMWRGLNVTGWCALPETSRLLL